MESSHRGLRRRVAALALEVVASKVRDTGPSEWVRGAIWPHLVFFSLDSRDKDNYLNFSLDYFLFVIRQIQKEHIRVPSYLSQQTKSKLQVFVKNGKQVIISQTYRCVSTFKEYCGSGSDGSVDNGLDQDPVHPVHPDPDPDPHI